MSRKVKREKRVYSSMTEIEREFFPRSTDRTISKQNEGDSVSLTGILHRLGEQIKEQIKER